MFTKDASTNLYSFTVNMVKEKPPSFTVMSEEVDKDDEKTGEVLITNKGTIPSVFSNPKWKQLYKGTVLITCNVSFINPSPTHIGSVGELVFIKKRVKGKLTTKLIANFISVHNHSPRYMPLP